jgi:hypothetical protein
VTTNSVYDSALELAAETRRLLAGQQNEQEAQQVASRVLKVAEELRAIADLVAVATSLASAGARPIDLSGIDAGRAAFAAKAANGLPPESAFRAAQQKLKTTSARIAAETMTVWSEWSSAEIAKLPLGRLALLPSERQKAARQKRAEVEKLARQPKPRRSDLAQFQVVLQGLRESLEEVPDPSPEIVALLAKIDSPPAPSLSDLTDEEIAMLRREGLDGQITLRRMGA